jgi:outer membrane biogenesis lipoprotein LolB
VRTRHLQFLILVAGIGLLGCGGGSRAELDATIDGVLEAYGGVEPLRSVKGYRMAGQLQAVQRGEKASTTRWFQRPDRLRVELLYPSGSEVRFTDGERAWTGPSPAEQRAARPAMVQSMRLQTIRVDFPLRLHDRRDEVEDLGLDDQGRRMLKLQIDAELAFTWHVDLSNYRIPFVQMQMAGPPAFTFSAEYGMFHRVEGGVLVAFHEKTWSGSTQTSEFTATDFELNPPNLKTMLRMPADI